MSVKHYLDAIAPGTGRVYDIQDVSGGKSITDITSYIQAGSTFGASDINAIGVLECNYAYSSGTHVLTTNNTASENIKFTATTAFSAGDAITFNGTTMTAVCTDGYSLTDGFWDANSVVYCIKSGTTLFFEGRSTSASQVVTTAGASLETLIGSLGNKKIVVGHVTLTYSSATLLQKEETTGLSSVDYAIAVASGTSASSSYPMVNSNGPPSLYIRKNYGTSGKITIQAHGTGFVSGHNYPVDYLAIGTA